MQLRVPNSQAQQSALADLRAVVAQQLPALPSAKDMGITPAVSPSAHVAPLFKASLQDDLILPSHQVFSALSHLCSEAVRKADLRSCASLSSQGQMSESAFSETKDCLGKQHVSKQALESKEIA